MDHIRIETDRFLLRPLHPGDASERYASWFADPAVRRHIVYARAAPSVFDLRQYILERTDRRDVLFLGIFLRHDATHIGNLKFEPIDHTARRAVLGIMIGEASWRGRGTATEVIVRANTWIAGTFGLREVILGVDRNHAAAIHAYEKAGFSIQAGDSNSVSGTAIRMVWRPGQEAAC